MKPPQGDPSHPEEPTLGVTIEREHLREATLRGVRWVAMGRVVAEVVALAASVVLARLIDPAGFGVVAIALAIQAIGAVLASAGIASALVQSEHVTQAKIQSAMALNVLTGAVASVALYMLVPLAEPLLGAEVVEGVQLVSIVFFVLGFGATPTALMQRRLDFRRLTTCEVMANLLGTAVSVTCALSGLGGESLIIGAIARSWMQTALAIWFAPPPWPRWDRVAVRELTSFGVPTALGSLGHLSFKNVDYAIVGAQLGAAQVGLYWRAYNMAFEYQHKITMVMQKMAFPIFSRSRDLDDMRALRYRIVRVHTTAIFPLLFLFIAIAPELIPWLYGDVWTPAVVPAQILAVAGFASPLLTGLGALVLAAGRPRPLAVANWIAAITYAATILLTARWGIIAVSLGVLGHTLLKLGLSHHFLMFRIVGIRFSQVRRESAPGLVSGVCLFGTSLGIITGLEAIGVPTALGLAAAVSGGLLVYVAVLRKGFPAAWGDVALLLRRVAGKRAVAAIGTRMPGAARRLAVSR